MIKDNKKEIIWNLVNSGLAGLLVFAGACVEGNITLKGVFLAFFAGLVVAVTKFKEYWIREEAEYSSKIFTFIG